tara:strand:- start:2 stop:298 length:297 start_codon:yes stop_codon:yes gene_type:complete
MKQLEKKVIRWAEERNLIKGSNPESQMMKLIEEVGELASDISKRRDVKDSIGDSLVVLTLIARQFGTDLEECYNLAYNEIKDRKGRMINGTFVKEEDL